MGSKCLAFSAMLAMAGVAFADVSVSEVAVRQAWPWSNAVNVYFTLSGVDEPVDASFSFTADGQALSIPPEAISGRRYCLSADGVYAISIDPQKAFGSGRATLSRFVADVTVAPSSGLNKEVLYRAFRLSDNTWTDITRGELLNGDFGAVETDYGRIGPGYSTTLEDVCIWTGITNDTKWARDYIVLRKIPAGRFTFNPTPYSNFWPTNSNCSTVTYDYWIGVYPMTQAQYGDIYAKGNGKATEWCGETGSDHVWEYGNVHTNALAPMGSLCASQVTGDWLCWDGSHTVYTGNQCFFARLYARTGFKFRCPSSFEWMKAARGGAPYRSYYYDGISLFTFTGYSTMAWDESGMTAPDYAAALGRFSANGDGAPSPVGSYRPNAYGLYDLVGNICEAMADTFLTDESGNTGCIMAETMKSGLLTDFVGNATEYMKSVSGGWYGSASGNLFWNRQYQMHSKVNRLEQIGLRICISDEAFRPAE